MPRSYEMVSITVCEQAVQLSDSPINTTSIHAAAISIHIGLVRQYRTSDTNSRGGSAPERNVTPCRLQDFHTEAENWCRIPASKWQCEWGYCLYPVLWPTGIEYCHKTSTRTDQISTRAFFPLRALFRALASYFLSCISAPWSNIVACQKKNSSSVRRVRSQYLPLLAQQC